MMEMEEEAKDRSLLATTHTWRWHCWRKEPARTPPWRRPISVTRRRAGGSWIAMDVIGQRSCLYRGPNFSVMLEIFVSS
jgi:hypothetical protein